MAVESPTLDRGVSAIPIVLSSRCHISSRRLPVKQNPGASPDICPALDAVDLIVVTELALQREHLFGVLFGQFSGHGRRNLGTSVMQQDYPL